MEGLRRNI